MLALLAALCARSAYARGGDATDAADALRAQQAALAEQLAHNVFQQPIHLDSSESGDRLSGDIYALVKHPFSQLSPSVKRPSQWCDVMVLVINVKRCEASERADGAGAMALNVGRKVEQPLEGTYRLEFVHRLTADTAAYLQVQLSADNGPFGTSDYRIVLEAIPSDEQHSFIHLRYAYNAGFAARLALQGYLSTVGRNKVGFSVVDRRPDGQPVYVRSVRGAIERTTMRYYLAITAYLDSLSAPPQERLERRLREWFAATERYPAQLHEIEQDEYLALKRKELRERVNG